MSAARARKVLIAAFAISLLLHLLLAGYIRWPFVHPSAEPETVTVHHITLARIIPHTPPPPPTPAPTPHATPAVKASVVPPSVQPHRGKGPPVARGVVPVPARTPAATATPAPTPTPTAVAQACAQHDISPAVTATADPVEIPPEARASKASGTAAIQVQIDPQGRVTNATVSQSSGNTGLDAVAMRMAKSASYSPALVKCKPVASTYTFTVKFVAW
jgi:TonB family protein